MRSGSRRVAASIAGLVLLACAGCGGEAPPAPRAPEASAAAAPEAPPEPGLPPTAKLPLLDELRRDRALPRSPSDGGGRAWFSPERRPRIPAQTPVRLTIVYEAGPEGIAPGGSILFETPKWWYWSEPQSQRKNAAGLVTATTRAAGVELLVRDEPATGFSIEVGGVAIEIRGRALRRGERVEIVYGAGEMLALSDAFAEQGTRLWLRVDGDGDGVRGVVADSPVLDVEAGPPAQLVATLPTTARVGDRVRLRLALLDGRGSWSRARDRVTIEATPGLEIAERASLREGIAEIEATVRAPGILRARALAESGFAAHSNPLVVLPQTPRVLWADVHGHSNLSDGTGSVADYFRYARDVAGLDVAALTDHDHIGRLPLESTPQHWQEIRETVAAFHEPGRFVTLLGFEWTSWIHGHRHVLYFDDDGPVISAADPARESPLALWSALRGKRAMTFAHHSAGGPIATNWEIPPDPELEPLTEIVSVHGSSEADDAPRKIYGPVPGHFVRDVLARGYRLGFVGSGDGHDGHPGLTHVGNSGAGGLTAILAESLDRDAVEAALRARRVYATNGPRIFLQAKIGEAPMGSVLAASAHPDARLAVLAVGETGFERIDVVRGAAVARSVAGEARVRIGFTEPLGALVPGEAIYVRAVQRDGGAAWSSPFFVE